MSISLTFNKTFFIYLLLILSDLFFYYSENAIPNSFAPCSKELCFEFAANMLSWIQNFDSALIQPSISVRLVLNSHRGTGFLPSEGKDGKM